MLSPAVVRRPALPSSPLSSSRPPAAVVKQVRFGNDTVTEFEALPQGKVYAKCPVTKSARGEKQVFQITKHRATGKELGVTLKPTFVEHFKAVRRYREMAKSDGVPISYIQAGYGTDRYKILLDHPLPTITAEDIMMPSKLAPGHFESQLFSPASPFKDVDISDCSSSWPCGLNLGSNR